MLRTRLWMGSILAALGVGVLLGDMVLAPWFPFLFTALLAFGLAGTYELLAMLPPASRPRRTPAYIAVAALLGSNWLEPVVGFGWDSWRVVGALFATAFLTAFLLEMYHFADDGTASARIAMTGLTVFWLGVLPCFLVQLRRLPRDTEWTTIALVLAIFVPKCCDIGAYFTGKLIGRHKMTPKLSPNKTWEGAIGGLTLAIVTAILLGETASIFPHGRIEAACFGLIVGIASMLGDLAESLVKRDCGVKDASQTIPGFGGVLDVIDSLLFAAPVAYVWFALTA